MSLFRTLQSQARTITFFLTETQASKLAPELRKIITGSKSGSDDTFRDDRVRINVSTSFPTRDQLKYISSIRGTGNGNGTVLQRCIDADVLTQLLLGDTSEDRVTVTERPTSRLFGTPLSQVSSEIWKCGENDGSSKHGSGSSSVPTGLWVDWERGVVGDSLESLRRYVDGLK